MRLRQPRAFLHEILLHGGRAAERELQVVLVAADRVGVSFDRYLDAGILFENRRGFAPRRAGRQLLCPGARLRELAGTHRTPDELARFFDGMDLIEPGVVSITRWRPEATTPGEPEEIDQFGGVGRKP